VSSKIHHKTLFSKLKAIFGSFNFSKAAQDNQEYIGVVEDKGVVARYIGAFNSLFKKSRLSVYEEAMRRNKFKETLPIIPPEDIPHGEHGRPSVGTLASKVPAASKSTGASEPATFAEGTKGSAQTRAPSGEAKLDCKTGFEKVARAAAAAK
jgi:hypothetical protein